MGSRQCRVCNAANFKYKCPSCLVPYCSLPCYRKHKEVPCGNASSLSSTILSKDAESTKAPQLMAQQRLFEVEDESWILQKDQLESLVATDEIRESLKNEDMQKLIYKIDKSTDAESELDSAIQGETFRLFTDKDPVTKHVYPSPSIPRTSLIKLQSKGTDNSSSIRT